MSNSKTFRLFLSSTFNDMRAERDKLQAEIFPKLRKYCEDRGFSFQPIDLRWGVSGEAGNDQKTMQICIDEVKRCKDALTPHFAIMLGERYGWIPLPAAVEANEFELVKKSITAKYPSDSKEIRYLNEWYQRDNNAIPAEYKLQAKLTKEQQDWSYWGDVENTLREAFRSVVNDELKEKLTDEQKFKYIKSATEQEIVEGLFNNLTAAKENIYFYNRKFENIDNLTSNDFATLEASDKAYRAEIETHNAANPNDKKSAYEITVKHFSDFKNATENELDAKIRASHYELINKIRTELPPQNVKTYSLKLEPSSKTTQDSVTEEYLQQFADDFEKNILVSIKKEIDDFQEVDRQTRELTEQQNFLHEKANIFVGREKIIKQIEDYLVATENHAPLVITADSGSGKSALMAKVIQNTLSKNALNTTTLYRFVGTTENSNNPTNLHQSLYSQLMQNEELVELRDNYLVENELQLEQVQSDLKELSKLISHLFENYPNEQQLNLFIDALDQFIIQDPLDWLPRTLPNNVKIVLSTLPDSYQGIPYLPKLKQKYKQAENYLYLEKFQAVEASAMIDEYLKSQHRKIIAPQKQKLLDAFSQSGSPLYLKILLEEGREWSSYTEIENEIYPSELEELIARLFNRLYTRSHHSLPLINYAFAYLACSKDGLPEPELFDILSQEPKVMADGHL